MVYVIGKRFVRGNQMGRSSVGQVEVNTANSTDIHDFLWNCTTNFDREVIDFVVEWYRPKQ